MLELAAPTLFTATKSEEIGWTPVGIGWIESAGVELVDVLGVETGSVNITPVPGCGVDVAGAAGVGSVNITPVPGCVGNYVVVCVVITCCVEFWAGADVEFWTGADVEFWAGAGAFFKKHWRVEASTWSQGWHSYVSTIK